MSRETVIVTGGARRVGAAIARHFAAQGFDIALHYNFSEAEAKALQQELQAKVTCQLFKHDLTDIAGLDGLMVRIKAAMPAVSVLINNASVFERASFPETDEALFDRQFNTNFKAPFFLTQAFARHVGKGSVVNVLDTGIATNQPSHFAYLLSKKALGDFTVMAARVLGPAIRVNGVCPGAPLPADAEDAAYVEKLNRLIPLQGQPSVAEVADAALWLCHQKHMTGQMLFVDGGQHVL